MIDYFLDLIQIIRKQDVNYLIKEIVEAESKFYYTHGYFSFWNDSMKLKRIKELEELKDV